MGFEGRPCRIKPHKNTHIATFKGVIVLYNIVSKTEKFKFDDGNAKKMIHHKIY